MKTMLRITYAVALLFVIGCSDEENDLYSEQPITVDLASDVYQNSNVGIYNGVFTSIDGQQRGSIAVTIPADEITKPTATLTFSNGEVISIEAAQTVTNQSKIVDLPFAANSTSLYFSVEANGTAPRMANVILNNNEGSILIKKHTSRAPVVPIPGTYICDECGTHPVLNNTITQTFNILMFTTPDGDSAFDTEVTLGMNVFNGTGSQASCVANGTETTCAISGDFMVSGAPITWSGTHTFNNEATGANDCSGASGMWEFVSNNFGTLSGTFISDNSCVTEVTLIDEDFEDSVITYTTSTLEFSDGFNDFFTRTDGSNISSSYQINGVLGSSFFAAQDIDGEVPSSEQSLSFENIDITGLNTLNFSALFAEDDDGTNQDWDAGDFLMVEYSFDGGVTWSPLFAIEANPNTYTGGNSSNGIPFTDTDFDGEGDGLEITDTFTMFESSFTNQAGATSMSLRIIMDLNSGDEDIAIDNILITGM